jgi:hypothetical protein
MLSGKKDGAPAPLVASYPRLQEITTIPRSHEHSE